MVVDNSGNAVQYDSATNTTVANMPIDTGHGLTGVSCHSTQFCVAVDANGRALTYTAANTSPWSSPVALVGSSGLNSVSCPSVQFCQAVDDVGTAFTYNTGVWSTAGAAVDGTAGITSVSCPSLLFCMAVDANGNGIAFHSPSWSPPHSVDGQLRSVSCPQPSFCVAVSANGFSSGGAYTYDTTNPSSQWSGNTQIDTVGLPQSVSCPSPSFCAVVDDTGHVMIGTD